MSENKPHIYFERGYWRVRPDSLKYQKRSLQRLQLWALAYVRVNRLNESEFTLSMRTAYYRRKRAESIAEYKARLLTSV